MCVKSKMRRERLCFTIEMWQIRCGITPKICVLLSGGREGPGVRRRLHMVVQMVMGPCYFVIVTCNYRLQNA